MDGNEIAFFFLLVERSYYTSLWGNIGVTGQAKNRHGRNWQTNKPFAGTQCTSLMSLWFSKGNCFKEGFLRLLHDVWAVEAAQMESDGLEYGGVFAQWKASLIWYVYACLCMGNQVITHD